MASPRENTRGTKSDSFELLNGGYVNHFINIFAAFTLDTYVVRM